MCEHIRRLLDDQSIIQTNVALQVSFQMLYHSLFIGARNLKCYTAGLMALYSDPHRRGLTEQALSATLTGLKAF